MVSATGMGSATSLGAAAGVTARPAGMGSGPTTGAGVTGGVAASTGACGGVVVIKVRGGRIPAGCFRSCEIGISRRRPCPTSTRSAVPTGSAVSFRGFCATESCVRGMPGRRRRNTRMPRTHRPRLTPNIHHIYRSFTPKLLDPIQPQINKLQPTTNHPTTTRQGIVSNPRHNIDSLNRQRTSPTSNRTSLRDPSTRNPIHRNIQHRLSRGRDRIRLPLMPPILTITMSIHIKTHRIRHGSSHSHVTIPNPRHTITTTHQTNTSSQPR